MNTEAIFDEADLDALTGLVLDPADPMPCARRFLNHRHVINGIATLQHQSGLFYQYRPEANAYAATDESVIRAELYGFLESAKSIGETKGNSTNGMLKPFKPTKAKVENIIDALRAVCNLPSSFPAPCWLDPSTLDPLDMMACRNGLVYLPERRMITPTPRFFTLNGIGLDFNATAPHPIEWFKFLNQLWPTDDEAIGTLQEWMGLLLTARTRFQKMLMLVGPKRSGKGTIARLIRHLCGDVNVCGPTLANMGEQFGLSGLIGKTVAIIADARMSGRTDTAVVTERLLSISGEDMLSIPRKYLPDWGGKLSTRFMLMTNELPRMEDSSGALSSRFLVLTLNESFYGREDHSLLERFIPELPGILVWALDGLDRLTARGRFIQPESASEMIQQLEDLGSPIGAFLRERCEVGRGFEVTADRAFEAWKSWCESNGRERAGSVQAFGRNLRAAVPWLKMTQPRICGHQIRSYEGLRLLEGEAR